MKNRVTEIRKFINGVRRLMESEGGDVFLGYHSSDYDLSGMEKGEVLDSDMYPELLRSAWIDFAEERDADPEEMAEWFEDKGYGFTFVSDDPIEASPYQTSKYKYGDYLFKVYGTGKELLMDDPNEIGATIVLSKDPLKFVLVEDE